MSGDLDVVHTCGVSSKNRSARCSKVTRSRCGKGALPLLVALWKPPFLILLLLRAFCGRAKSRPERICFAKTNGNRAELDRVGFSAHRFEACQNSMMMTSLQ